MDGWMDGKGGCMGGQLFRLLREINALQQVGSNTPVGIRIQRMPGHMAGWHVEVEEIGTLLGPPVTVGRVQCTYAWEIK